ncbi:MAG: hypothetical protein U0904_06280 [Candidatus Nanopelagicales bacterium]|nr:hypothetical protein [Candidatus Nanopelagicales bacterium]
MGSGRSRRGLALLIGIVLVGVVGACSSPEPEPASPEPFPQQPGVPPPSEVWPTPDVWPCDEPIPGPGGPANVKLSTRCGIQFLRFDGYTWETSPFGGGGPPPGWPSPYAKGRVVYGAEIGGPGEPTWTDVIFESKYEPRELRFHFTTKTPPPCP